MTIKTRENLAAWGIALLLVSWAVYLYAWAVDLGF